MAKPPRIFLSYRRSDWVGPLYDLLRRRFGKKNVFKDTEAIGAGADFPDVLMDRIPACDVFLAVIGPQWEPKRLAKADDFVRREIELALLHDVYLIPVQINGGVLPADHELPDSLKPLLHRNAFELTDRRWTDESAQLISTIRSELARRRRARLRRAIVSRKGALAGIATTILFLLVGLFMSRERINPPKPHTTPTATTSSKTTAKKVESGHPLGIDLATLNGGDWTRLPLKVSFVFARATRGTDSVDPQFATNWKKIRELGYTRGASHVFVGGSDPVRQADFFVDTVVPAENDLLAVYVYVNYGVGPPDPNRKDFSANLHKFLNRVEKRTHRKPLINTRVNYWNSHLDDSFSKTYALWTETSVPLPRNWQRLAMWQYTRTLLDSGEVTVIEFLGTRDELLALAH